MNMLKPDSLYNKGMKVLTYSTKRAEEHNISWKKEGERKSCRGTEREKRERKRKKKESEREKREIEENGEEGRERMRRVN